MTDKSIQIKSNQTSLGSLNYQIPSNGVLKDLFDGKPTFSEHIDSENLVTGETKSIMQAIEALKVKPPLTDLKSLLLKKVTLEEYLFDARANVKTLTSAVSMHINPELKVKLFRQIDMLHDPDEWESNDVPINKLSFKAFLSGFIQINPERGPGLGLSYTGNLIAAWITDRDRLIIEFMPNSVKWVITRFINDESEQFTGHTKITRLFESLAPFDPKHWFSKKEETDVHT